jgi:hypothetical protein
MVSGGCGYSPAGVTKSGFGTLWRRFNDTQKKSRRFRRL